MRKLPFGLFAYWLGPKYGYAQWERQGWGVRVKRCAFGIVHEKYRDRELPRLARVLARTRFQLRLGSHCARRAT
jgi:hypothetical protein